MTVNRTTLLDLPLPVTGTESGTWGDTTNNGLTQYMDIAIAGMSNLTSANFTTGALTIETTEGNSSATNISATSAQYAGFRVTSLAQNSTITVGNTGTNPARSYRLINADATYTLTFKATGQTGITLQPGQTAVVAFNGTDYVIVGMAGAGTVTDNAVVRFDGTTGKLVQNSVVTIADSTGDIAGAGSITSTSASGILTRAAATQDGVELIGRAGGSSSYKVTLTPTTLGGNRTLTLPDTTGTVALTGSTVASFSAGSTGFTPNTATTGAVTLAGTLATTNGGTGLTSFTANGVVYASSSSALATGSALTFDGTSVFTVNRSTSKSTIAIGDTAASSYSQLLLYGGATFYNWSLGAQYNFSNSFEITPSTAAGGTTFNSPVYYVNNSGVHVWFSGGSEAMRLTSTGLGIGTSSPSQKFEVYKGAGDTLVYGSNPRLALTVPTGQNGLRVTADTTPLELLHLTDGSQVSVSGTMNMAVNAANATAGSTFKSSPTIAFLSKYWNGAASVSQFQGFIGVTATAATSTGGYFGLGVGSADALRIDPSGNLGLGVTPSAWSVAKGFEIASPAGITSAGTGLNVGTNTYFNGSNWIYKTSAAATLAVQTNGTHYWSIAASGTAGNAITFTQAMTLDASGRLGIGTTSPAAPLHVKVATNANFTAQNTGGVVQLQAINDAASAFTQLDIAGSFITFSPGSTERARITSGGDLLVGTTSAVAIGGRNSKVNVVQSADGVWAGGFVHSTSTGTEAFGVAINYSASAPNSSLNPFLYCTDNTAVRAEIRSNGGLANYSANDANLSDRREKTNFAPAGEYLSKICAIPVQTFNYIDQSEDDPGLTLGVVAQDVQAVAPELVMESNWGTKENPKMRLSIYQTDLQYALMKCIQEQQALIESLTSRVAQLEGTQP